MSEREGAVTIDGCDECSSVAARPRQRAPTVLFQSRVCTGCAHGLRADLLAAEDLGDMSTANPELAQTVWATGEVADEGDIEESGVAGIDESDVAAVPADCNTWLAKRVYCRNMLLWGSWRHGTNA